MSLERSHLILWEIEFVPFSSIALATLQSFQSLYRLKHSIIIFLTSRECKIASFETPCPLSISLHIFAITAVSSPSSSFSSLTWIQDCRFWNTLLCLSLSMYLQSSFSSPYHSHLSRECKIASFETLSFDLDLPPDDQFGWFHTCLPILIDCLTHIYHNCCLSVYSTLAPLEPLTPETPISGVMTSP